MATHLMKSMYGGQLFPSLGPLPLLTPLQDKILMDDSVNTSTYGESGGQLQPLTVINWTNKGTEPTLSENGVLSGTQAPLAPLYEEQCCKEPNNFTIFGMTTNLYSITTVTLWAVAMYYGGKQA